MGIFDMFGAGREEKANVAAEKRQMGFQREQDMLKITAPEEQTEMMNQEGKSDLLKWQQDLDDELMELIYRLKGYAKSDGEFKKIQGHKALCNDKFVINVVIPQCKPFMSRNLINSTFTEERILLDLKHTSNDIMANMADGFDTYDIEFQNYDLILRLIKNIIKAGAFRALNGFTKKTDSTIFKKLESSFDNANAQQQGLFKRFTK